MKASPPAPAFDLDCRRCSRLSAYLDQVSIEFPAYHARPVPSFGDKRARFLIVGLAPGLHGANASGRPFTGDHAGIILYHTLHAHGFSDRPESLGVDDGLRLRNCRITNAVKCLPPQNKPLTAEVNTCNDFLRAELAALPEDAVVMALGTIAHRSVLRACGERPSHYPFAHGVWHRIGSLHLIDSYHCSRYNTQTRRLTPEMFDAVFDAVRGKLGRP